MCAINDLEAFPRSVLILECGPPLPNFRSALKVSSRIPSSILSISHVRSRALIGQWKCCETTHRCRYRERRDADVARVYIRILSHAPALETNTFPSMQLRTQPMIR